MSPAVKRIIFNFSHFSPISSNVVYQAISVCRLYHRRALCFAFEYHPCLRFLLCRTFLYPSNLDTVHGPTPVGEEDSVGRGHHEAVSARAVKVISVENIKLQHCPGLQRAAAPSADLSAHISDIRFLNRRSVYLRMSARRKSRLYAAATTFAHLQTG